MRRFARAGLLAIACFAIAGAAPRGGLPASTLAVRSGGAWRTFWRSGAAPGHWSAPDSTLARALEWRPLRDGVAIAEARLSGTGASWRTRLIVARLDPARVQLRLEMALGPEDGRPLWTIERMPDDAVLAVNAGQFVRTLPWGWVVIEGREHLSAEAGPLAEALAFDAAGRPRWFAADSLVKGRAAARESVVTAFESYPVLLRGGDVPEALGGPGRGVDVAHHDVRLAIGETREGRLLVAMTRFDALGDVANAAPTGLTTPEMAAVMGALGARDAMCLDGGISAQMAVRDSAGAVRAWRGWRKVPLALVATPR